MYLFFICVPLKGSASRIRTSQKQRTRV